MTALINAPPSQVRRILHEDLQFIAQTTSEDVWERLRGRRLFITGGTGFVGCWLLEALVWANHKFELGVHIDVLTRRPDAFTLKAPRLANDPSIRLIQGDMNDLASMGGQYDLVVHAATDVVSPSSDPYVAFDAIVNGTSQVLDLASRAGAQRFLYVSSGAVYGRQPTDMPGMAENYCGAPSIDDPRAAYGHGKRVSEWLVRSLARRHGIEPVIARLFALVGPYLPLDARFAASTFISDALAGRPITVTGDRRTVRSYIYCADMAVWLLTLLAKGEAFGAYNVGSDQPITIGELASRVSERFGSGMPVNCLASSSTGSDDEPAERYVPDTQKIRSDLGLQLYTSLDTALARTISWFREEQAL
ncbi:NAD-dependent epimerase/dehydratase family protein [Trinickia fusca]|uniref:NAD-dependent epimerase/dehydratase family protein n=1 Tax=Trinickia fusca TaxID=2419777 RepID=A0A494XRY8_9BURK|nr:NAD-dependent epimerase/dehydratase family protein [Trinickia fusca]RKP50859.1 NAD-dependent epimerase/dehydratase family protein [Trinickia fusca]